MKQLSTLADLRDSLSSKLVQAHPLVFQEIDLEETLHTLVTQQEDLYRKVSPKIESQVSTIEQNFGVSAREDFCRLLLASLMYNWFANGRHYAICERIGTLYLEDVDRLVSDIDGGAEEGRFELYNDIYIKDLQCFTGRLYPAANATVSLTTARMPRGYLFYGPPSYWPGNLLQLAKVGGFDHFTSGHLHKPRYHRHKVEYYWQNIVLRADVCRALPRLRGNAGSSWMGDPQVAKISPRHSYQHEISRRFNVRLVPIHTSEATIQDAISTSPTRRRLYEEGKYIPQAYFFVWDRRQVIAAGEYALANKLAE